MKSVIIIAIAVVFLFVPVNVFAVDFVDSSGYTPSWAIGNGYHTVLVKCTQVSGDSSSDSYWCLEWMAYVLDQGIENFPQSTSENSKPSIPDFTLEEGPHYSGVLTKFLPDEFTYGEKWLVGKPYAEEIDSTLKSVGVKDIINQRVVIPDEFDEYNYMTLKYIIIETENLNTASQFFSKIKEGIKSQNFPTESEYFELEEQGIFKGAMEIKKTTRFFVADCTGVILNLYKENEGAALNCIKDNYIVGTQASWKNEIYNTFFTSVTPKRAAEDYAKIIITNIDNDLHKDPTVNFPSNAQNIAYHYSIGKLTDDELLDYFQKSIDAGGIKFSTDSITIEKNSQRLSYIPDLPRIQIISWGEGKMTDSQFAETMMWLVERGYLTIPGFDSSSIAVSSEEKEPFFDMPDDNEPKVANQPTQSQTIKKSSSDSETPAWAMGLAAFVVFGLPIIIIALIIWKIKQRRRKIDLSKSFNR